MTITLIITLTIATIVGVAREARRSNRTDA